MTGEQNHQHDLTTRVAEGFLVLADISGYTEFLTETEIDHSHEIIRELTSLIRDRLAPPMRFVKIEGDAVFCCLGVDAIDDGERVLELIERCYLDFSDRLVDMKMSTTCACNACAAIGSLDLKFVVHLGSYVIDADPEGREDLSGPDVILVHRLLKNSIIEDGGPDAYAFFTGAGMSRLPDRIALNPHRELVETFGEVDGGVHDLGGGAETMRNARRVRVTSNDADVEVCMESPAPPRVVWQYFVDPAKRGRWMVLETGIEFGPNDNGRVAAGAVSHCAHGPAGDAFREYLDWRPHDYVTSRFTPAPDATLMPRALETFEFTPSDGGGTTFWWRIRAEDRSDESMARFEALARAIAQLWHTLGERLRTVLAEDGRLTSGQNRTDIDPAS